MHNTSDETIRVLSGMSQKIADEYPCNASFIRGIKAGAEKDTFFQFLPLFSAASRAGAPVCHWINKLLAIRDKHQKCLDNKTHMNHLAELITLAAKCTANYAESVADGVIDEREARAVLRDLDGLERAIAGVKAKLFPSVEVERGQI